MSPTDTSKEYRSSIIKNGSIFFLLRAMFSFCDKGCFNYKLPFVIDSISNNVCKYDVSQLYLAISCTFHLLQERKKYCESQLSMKLFFLFTGKQETRKPIICQQD